MPARNAKGQFISNSDLSVALPGLSGLYKILIIGLLIFPWYVILSNKNFSGLLFGYLLGGTDFCPKCQECQKCQVCPQCPQCPQCPVPECPECKLYPPERSKLK